MFEIEIPMGIEMEFSSRRVSHDEMTDAVRAAVRGIRGRLGNESARRWTWKSDCSCGWELTTPVLRNEEEFNLALKAIKDIQHEFPGRDLVDSRCGLHIHFDFSRRTEQDVLKVVRAFQKIEPLIYRLVPQSRQSCSYCYPLARHSRVDIGGHYQAVNGARWESRGDIEIRYGGATCNRKKIRNWCLLLQGIVKRSLESTPRRQIDNVEDLRNWLGDSLTDADEEVLAWASERVQWLIDHNPHIHRERYMQARAIRRELEPVHRHYHYHLRRQMNRDREQLRAHDQMVLDLHSRGELEQFEIPEEWVEQFYNEHPQHRPEQETPVDPEPATEREEAEVPA